MHSQGFLLLKEQSFMTIQRVHKTTAHPIVITFLFFVKPQSHSPNISFELFGKAKEFKTIYITLQIFRLI